MRETETLNSKACDVIDSIQIQTCYGENSE